MIGVSGSAGKVELNVGRIVSLILTGPVERDIIFPLLISFSQK